MNKSPWMSKQGTGGGKITEKKLSRGRRKNRGWQHLEKIFRKQIVASILGDRRWDLNITYWIWQLRVHFETEILLKCQVMEIWYLDCRHKHTEDDPLSSLCYWSIASHPSQNGSLLITLNQTLNLRKKDY